MRILDKGGVRARLRRRWASRATRSSASSQALTQPHGILLVTGPTGSGKTTTLYTALDRAQQARREDRHRRGPGRVPDAGHQPDPGEAADRPHVRERAALDRAPGPGHHHGRRDPRPRDGADRHAVGADRPPGAVDGAHERRAVDGEPAARHGRRGLPAHLDGRSASSRSAWCARCARSAASRTRRCPRWSSRWASRASRPAGDVTLYHAGGLPRNARAPATGAACRSSRC